MKSSLDLFGLEQRLFLVKNYYQELGNYTCVQYNYEDTFRPHTSGNPAFSREALKDLMNLFEDTGSVWTNPPPKVNWSIPTESPFKCELCELSFLSFSRLKQHVLKSHNLDDVYKCDFCSMDFRRKYKFLRHMKSHGDENIAPRRLPDKFRQCENCGQFCSVETIGRHRESHRRESPLKCLICDEMFTWSIGYKVHMLKHNNREEIRGQNVAGEKVLKMETVVKIERDSDPQRDPFFAEPEAPEVKASPALYNPADNYGLCEVCGKIVSSKGNLKIHMRTHTKGLPFKCNIDGCYREYRWPTSLEFHLSSVHDKSRGRSIKCTLCDKSFVYKNDLRTHMRAVHSEDIFSCDFCTELFTEKEQLDNHLTEWHTLEATRVESEENFHQPTSVKRLSNSFVCIICDKSFRYKTLLKHHMKSHEKTDEAFKCPESGCGKSFHSDKNLKSHIATHSRKRFKCADCDKTYSEFRSVRAHIKRDHLKIQRFKCRLCPYSGWYADSFRGHMNRHKKYDQTEST
ncbi:zinc finger protein 227-like [Phlebotomus argentipes]|uniref:zinc finger protein 227-like n=1 Tax=Phlebotomus argentipes TaxID=94469 RepID=UPI002892BD04|nr:zinc finger protein 227-like [Phlebotomus argentipes]